MDWVLYQTKNKTVRNIIKILVIKLVKLYLASVVVDFATSNRWVMREFFYFVGHQLMVEVFHWAEEEFLHAIRRLDVFSKNILDSVSKDK